MGRKEMAPACRDYTLHLHKRLQGVQFKKRAPRCIRDIKRFAQKEMYTKVSFLWWILGTASIVILTFDLCLSSHVVNPIVIILSCRTWESTTVLTEPSGLTESGTSPEESVFASPADATKMRTPRKSSTRSCSTSKLTRGTTSALRRPRQWWKPVLTTTGHVNYYPPHWIQHQKS